MPLRVPVCTLTEVLWHIHYRDELEDMRLPQGLLPRSFNCKAIVLQMHYIYHRCRYYQLQVSKYYAYSY